MEITSQDVDRLLALDEKVHYREPPPPGQSPFVAVARPSPVLLSAPHGARSCRNEGQEVWHHEEEYTAAMARFLAERCRTSVIATIWRTDGSDPNYHGEEASAYKRELRRLVREAGVRWVIDLHGASEFSQSMPRDCLVDLGTRQELQSLPRRQLDALERYIEAELGPGAVSHNAYPARIEGRTISAYCHGALGVHAVQVEMKPAVRVPFFGSDSFPGAAKAGRVVGMLRALAGFVEYLHSLE